MPRNPPRSPDDNGIRAIQRFLGLIRAGLVPVPRPPFRLGACGRCRQRLGLEESWVRPDATGYMMTSGLADEFAATLCAYGMAAAEADHMLGRMDQALAHQPARVEG